MKAHPSRLQGRSGLKELILEEEAHGSQGKSQVILKLNFDTSDWKRVRRRVQE